MKATIDFDESLYRRLKVEAARRGRTIKDLVDEGVRLVLNGPPAAVSPDAEASRPWFGILREYSAVAEGAHDLESVRKSIGTGRDTTTRGTTMRDRSQGGNA